MTESVGRENEGRLLACILWSPEILPRVLLRTTADHFQYHPYRLLYQVIESLAEDRQAVDDLAIVQRAKALGKLDAIGGAAAVASLSGLVAGSSAWEVYADRLADADRRRRMLVVLREASAQLTEGRDTGSVAFGAAAELHKIAADGVSGSRTMAEIAAEVFNDIKEAAENPEKRKGIPSRIASIDIVAGEMLPGDLIILAGRPSMGKTAVLMSMIRASRRSSLVASAEMTGYQLVLREMSAGSGLTYQQLVNGTVTEDSWPPIAATAGNPALKSVRIVDSGRMTLERIAEEAYRAKQRSGIEILAVDYLQLIYTGRRFERRDLEIGEITRGLKGIAKDLELVVMVAAQINREAEKSGGADKRPRLHHLRESGAIEQDADRVYGVYRHGKYSDKMPEHLMRITEIGVEKNRNGPIGRAFLEFDPPTMSFSSADHQIAQEYRAYIEVNR